MELHLSLSLLHVTSFAVRSHDRDLHLDTPGSTYKSQLHQCHCTRCQKRAEAWDSKAAAINLCFAAKAVALSVSDEWVHKLPDSELRCSLSLSRILVSTFHFKNGSYGSADGG
jgi:hypothetical protein